MPIDYEAEYNNRARVPEHPPIIAAWQRDAALYREAMKELMTTVRYGEGERHALDLFMPERQTMRTIVVFIHGGYWQALDRSFFSHCARGLNARGVAVAVPGYDLCPHVRVMDIIHQMRRAMLALVPYADRLVVSGHSAGGHLAACLLATDWKAVSPSFSSGFVSAAYTISGLFDLAPLISTSINTALRLDEADAFEASPLRWPAPRHGSVDAVVGGDEGMEYHRQSMSIAERWGQSGVATRFESVPGANHFTVIAPLADPMSAMTERLAELAS